MYCVGTSWTHVSLIHFKGATYMQGVSQDKLSLESLNSKDILWLQLYWS